MKALAFRTGLILLAAAMAASTHAEGLSARDAVRQALEHGNQGQVIRLDSLSASLGHTLARTPFLPGLDFSAGATATRTLQSGTNDDFNTLGSNAGLVLSWPLFRGLAGLADSRRATAEALRGQAMALQAADRLAVATLDAWLTVRLAERRLVIARDNELISQDRYQQDSLRRDLGALAPQVLLSGELALNADRSARLAREQEVRSATSRLALLLALPEDRATPGQDSLELALPLPDVDVLVSQAREEGPEGTVARLDESIAIQRERATRGALLPRLDLLGSVTQRETHTKWSGGSETDLSARSAAAGLGLTWELYTGGQSGVDRQRARISSRQAGLRLEDTMARTEAEARLALGNWQTLDQQRELVLGSVEVARRQLDLVSRQYALGSANSLDFRDAQLSLAGAKQNLAILDREWTLARLEIERLRGRLLEAILGEE